MVRFIKSGIVLFIACLFFISCRKEAGPGGLATIRGKVYGRDITTGGNLKAEGYVPDWRVYISVAGNPSYFDDVRTSYDGSYEFRFLRKGTYDIWTFSDCDTCLIKAQVVMAKGIEINDKRGTVTVPDLGIIY